LNQSWNRRLVGAKIGPTFVIDTLDFYLKFYRRTKKKEEINHRRPSKKINLISFDGVIFKVDYGVTTLFHTDLLALRRPFLIVK
jgi:hypothetical protein